MYSRILKSLVRNLALVCVVMVPLALAAQAQDAHKPAAKAAASDSPSRWDIFAGYSFFWPKGTVNGNPEVQGVGINSYKPNRVGTTESLSYFFNNHFGWQIDSGQHDLAYNTGYANTGASNSGIFSIQTGPVYRFPGEHVTPFIHGLVGAADVEGPQHQPYTWGPTFSAGFGFDLKLGHRISWRMIQADYEYIHENYGSGGCGNGAVAVVTSANSMAVRPMATGCSGQPGGTANINAMRLSSGIVFGVGSIAPPPPITIACSASPTSVFPGDPVALTATAGGLNPKMNAIYSWTGAGVAGSGTTASVATAALAPGTYTVNCGVKEGKAGKEGLKPWESASSTATFTVKAFEPPTASCSASPSTIKPGETSNITAQGVSPQNRPLTYAYSASSGTVTGSGNSAVFNSAGAPTGTSAITCTVTDDKGQAATANTGVTITAPYVAPIPHTQALCSINFSNDKKRPSRVDNEAKACLDEVALDLQRQSDAKAVVVGDSTAAEKVLPKHARKHAKLEDFAGERAVNTREYLVTEKGIDASRITVATGATDAQKVENYLVPSGATFSNDVSGTTPIDTTVVKPQVRKALPQRHRAMRRGMHPVQSVKPPSKQ